MKLSKIYVLLIKKICSKFKLFNNIMILINFSNFYFIKIININFYFTSYCLNS